jgi:hypothetical protein
MALIVAPADGFDSLVSLADADTYNAAMGNATWTGTDEVKEAALRRATQYLLSHYQIKSEYLDPVHKNVAAACCEAAVRALTGALYTDVTASVVTEKTVGPITVTYDTSVRNGGQTRFALIDDLLRGLTDGGFGMIRLVRG